MKYYLTAFVFGAGISSITVFWSNLADLFPKEHTDDSQETIVKESIVAETESRISEESSSPAPSYITQVGGIRNLIQLYTQHPDDPLSESSGIDDQGIVDLPVEVVEELYEEGIPFAQDKIGDEPNLLMGIGRVAFNWGEIEEARNMFQAASENGSLPASYYLTKDHFIAGYEVEQDQVVPKPLTGEGFQTKLRLLKNIIEFPPAEAEYRSLIGETVKIVLDATVGDSSWKISQESLVGIHQQDARQLLSYAPMSEFIEGDKQKDFNFGLGRLAFAHQQYETAVPLLAKAAELGSSDAAFLLGGEEIQSALGLPDEVSNKLLGQAAEQGHREASMLLKKKAEEKQAKTINFDILAQGKLLKALYDGTLTRANPQSAEDQLFMRYLGHLFGYFEKVDSAFLIDGGGAAMTQGGILAVVQEKLDLSSNVYNAGNLHFDEMQKAMGQLGTRFQAAGETEDPLAMITTAMVAHRELLGEKGLLSGNPFMPFNENSERVANTMQRWTEQAGRDSTILVRVYKNGGQAELKKLYDAAFKFINTYQP